MLSVVETSPYPTLGRFLDSARNDQPNFFIRIRTSLLPLFNYLRKPYRYVIPYLFKFNTCLRNQIIQTVECVGGG